MEKIKQVLKEMELTDEQIQSFISQAITDKFVPKHRFDEVNEKNKQLVSDVADRDKQINDLSSFKGDNEALKVKIAKLEEDNKLKEAQNAEAIKTLKVDNAINYALNGKVQEGYDDLVVNLIDKSSIVLKDDGSIVGLDEQIDKVMKEKPLLFVEEKGNSTQTTGWSFKGTDPQDTQRQTAKSISENFVQSLLADNKQVSEVTAKASEFYFGKE
jgi:hypothetical protein